MKPGRELDALVATKVMGWKSKDDIWMLPDGGGVYKREWSPSTDIKAAWEVVEKVILDSKCPEGFQLSNGDIGQEYEMCDAKKWGASFDNGYGNGTFSDGESAPHVICLSALASVGVEVPE